MANELYHYKYVKREKVGDKWKYYYDTGALKNIKSKVEDKVGITAKRNMQAAQIYLDNAKTNEKHAENETARAAQIYKDNIKKGQKLIESQQQEVKKKDLSNLSNTAKDDRFSYSKGGNSRSGDDVKRIQSTLKNLGYDVDTSGEYDDKTYKTIMKFQKDQGIRINGITGEDTIAALEKASGTTIKPGKGYDTRDADTKRMKDANEKARAATAKREEAGANYTKAQQEYMNTPLYKVETAVDSAKKWTSEAIDKVEKARDKHRKR